MGNTDVMVLYGIALAGLVAVFTVREIASAKLERLQNDTIRTLSAMLAMLRTEIVLHGRTLSIIVNSLPQDVQKELREDSGYLARQFKANLRQNGDGEAENGRE